MRHISPRRNASSILTTWEQSHDKATEDDFHPTGGWPGAARGAVDVYQHLVPLRGRTRERSPVRGQLHLQHLPPGLEQPERGREEPCSDRKPDPRRNAADGTLEENTLRAASAAAYLVGRRKQRHRQHNTDPRYR